MEAAKNLGFAPLASSPQMNANSLTVRNVTQLILIKKL